MSVIADAISNLVILEENKDEGLINYTWHFKSALDFFVLIMVDQYVQQLLNLIPATSEQSERHADEQLMTFSSLNNSDHQYLVELKAIGN